MNVKQSNLFLNMRNAFPRTRNSLLTKSTCSIVGLIFYCGSPYLKDLSFNVSGFSPNLPVQVLFNVINVFTTLPQDDFFKYWMIHRQNIAPPTLPLHSPASQAFLFSRYTTFLVATGNGVQIALLQVFLLCTHYTLDMHHWKLGAQNWI